ncbi:MAG TPA: S-methyl-5-thioribose-1-phosphate isomerase [Thermoanaerobaculia bacterium]|nr:S-methyl-5-thioribose-1-phosphate isomerase [Thermoanaerobaculia bacterium]
MTEAGLTTRVVPYAYEAGRLRVLDQRRLPHEEVVLECESAAQTAEAIRSLAVRGAPLIGIAAAFGLCAEARRVAARSPEDLDAALEAAMARLSTARPTAVNLAAAVERMRCVVDGTVAATPAERIAALEREAGAIAEEDRAACAEMGRRGAEWILARVAASSPLTVLTHCNAGALATAGIGTALGVVRALALHGEVRVFADETRPFLQGARLTAWELQRDGLSVTLLPDVAAAATIAAGRVDVVVVGADRIARNGDVANKVGTYGLALACRAHGVPFVVAVPTTTLDRECPDGAAIPIEFRGADEVLTLPHPSGQPLRLGPPGVPALYPAFDVTPSALVSAIVTERGISEPPHDRNLGPLLP